MQFSIKPQITLSNHARMTNYDRGTRVITLLQLLSSKFGDSATILRRNLEIKNAGLGGEITQETYQERKETHLEHL